MPRSRTRATSIRPSSMERSISIPFVQIPRSLRFPHNTQEISMDYAALPRTFFYVVMVIDIAGWLVLLMFPRRPWANFWGAGLIAPLVLSLISVYFLVAYSLVPPILDFGDFRS